MRFVKKKNLYSRVNPHPNYNTIYINLFFFRYYEKNMFISNSNKLWWFQTRREELFQSGGRGRYLPFCIVGGGGMVVLFQNKYTTF